MSKSIQCLFIANTEIVSASLEQSLSEAFQSAGVILDIIYPDSINLFKKFSLLGRINSRIIDLIYYKKITLFKKLKKLNLKTYTFIFVLKGTDVTPKMLKYIKNKNIPVVCYNPDNPYNNASSNKNIQNSISLYDIYFIWSKKLCSIIEKKENVKTVYLPFAADLKLHNIQNLKAKITAKYPISFIGNWDEEREIWLTQIEKKISLSLFGNNWAYKLKSNTLKKCYTGYSVLSENFTKTVQETAININILRLQNKNSNNMRTFEILASGGFLLHEYSEEVAELFIEGQEIEFFRDKEELNSKIEFYLNNIKKAQEIAHAGNIKISANNHTYDQRVKTILLEVKKNYTNLYERYNIKNEK